MVSEITKDRIEKILKARLGATYSGADIDARPDNDGDPAIYIRAHFDPAHAIPPSSTIVDTMVALRDLLLASEDSRFPYLRPVYPEEPANDEAA